MRSAHDSPRPTKPYDRTIDQLTLDVALARPAKENNWDQIRWNKGYINSAKLNLRWSTSASLGSYDSRVLTIFSAAQKSVPEAVTEMLDGSFRTLINEVVTMQLVGKRDTHLTCPTCFQLSALNVYRDGAAKIAAR